MIFVGDDWAESHHDIEIVDDQGRRLARRRLPEGVEGLAGLHALVADQLGDGEDLAEAGDPAQVIIGIETDRGPWVQALVGRGTGCMRSIRCRWPGIGSGTARPGPRAIRGTRTCWPSWCGWTGPITGRWRRTPGAEQVKVLARAHQNLVWARQRQANALRSMLREYYPAALAAFGTDLAGRDALAVLTLAPGPEQGRALSLSKIEAALRRAGRRRYLRVTAEAIQAALRSPQLPANPAVVPAYTASAAAMVAVLAALAEQEQALRAQVEAGFGQHPDAEIYLSQPGLGPILAARVLAEFGDAPGRYADARARKNYSGMAPITKASGSGASSWPATPATVAWPTPSTSRPSPPCGARPEPAATTTLTAPPAPPTTRPCAPWPTASSAYSTAAWNTTPTTTRTSPGSRSPHPTATPLDALEPWDV